jgi:hypothetical protein
VEGLGHEIGLTFERTDVNEGGELGGRYPLDSRSKGLL